MGTEKRQGIEKSLQPKSEARPPRVAPSPKTVSAPASAPAGTTIAVDLDRKEVYQLIGALDERVAEKKRLDPLSPGISELKKLASKMHGARRELGGDPNVSVGVPRGPLGKMRIAPPEIEDQLPPHRIEFYPNDLNIGRSCARCGFAIPEGCRYSHGEWCEKRNVEPERVTDADLTPHPWGM